MTGTRGTKVREHLNVEEEQHALFKQWADSANRESQLFPSMTSMFIYAVSLGFAAGSIRPIKGRRVDVIRWLQLSDQIDIPVIEAVAVAHTGDIEVLGDRERILEIAEHCATGGVDILRMQLIGNRERNLETLAKLALEYGSVAGPKSQPAIREA